MILIADRPDDRMSGKKQQGEDRGGLLQGGTRRDGRRAVEGNETVIDLIGDLIDGAFYEVPGVHRNRLSDVAAATHRHVVEAA